MIETFADQLQKLTGQKPKSSSSKSRSSDGEKKSFKKARIENGSTRSSEKFNEKKAAYLEKMQKEEALLAKPAKELSEEETAFLKACKTERNIAEQKSIQKEAIIRRRAFIKTAAPKLIEYFPKVFGDPLLPLKIGALKDIYTILNEKEGYTHVPLQNVIRIHTRKIAYLEAIINGDHRYDLEGNVCGDITEDEKTYAKETLQKVKQRIEERKAAREA